MKINLLFLLCLFFALPVSAEPYLFNYAIDADGKVIDLSGYSRDGIGEKPKRIKLYDANLFEQQQPLHNEFRQPNEGRNPVQWDTNSSNRIPCEYWSPKAKDSCPSRVRAD